MPLSCYREMNYAVEAEDAAMDMPHELREKLIEEMQRIYTAPRITDQDKMCMAYNILVAKGYSL